MRLVEGDAAHHHYPTSEDNEHHWFLYCVLVFVSNEVMISSFSPGVCQQISDYFPSLVQRAGFEPANQYGLGPHPSAFDQAGQPLPSLCSGGLFLKATGVHPFL